MNSGYKYDHDDQIENVTKDKIVKFEVEFEIDVSDDISDEEPSYDDMPKLDPPDSDEDMPKLEEIPEDKLPKSTVTPKLINTKNGSKSHGPNFNMMDQYLEPPVNTNLFKIITTPMTINSIEKLKKSFLEPNKHICKLEVDLTNGITSEQYITRLYGAMTDCESCFKYFKQDMMVEAGADQDRWCLHCYFWINYDVSLRRQADGGHGGKIVDYVMKCAKSHNGDECTRKMACFLCDYNNGNVIPDILDSDKIYTSRVLTEPTDMNGVQYTFEDPADVGDSISIVV